jgi:exodeoxyribonuclease V alpha subunit
LLEIGSSPPWHEREFTLDLDLLIVDEASMIDAPLFATLLKALPNHCKTVLMGDPNQLSPVGIGNVFHDLVASKDPALCRTQLKRSMRTDNQEILGISHQVLQGKLPNLLLASMSDFFSFSASALEPDPKQLLQDLQRRRILSCLRVGPQGSDAMNEATLKQILRATPTGKWWWAPLMILSNDEATGLCNGELGLYIEKKGMKESGYAYFPKNQNRVPFYELPKFEWAFCSSVHKSQGSEFEEVIILVPKGSEKFGREMLYTAITRAKHSVKIVAEKQTLEAMVSKSQAKHSGLI